MKNTRVMADRLSDLPEHLIHRILSFLSNKEATIFSASSKWLSSIWSSFPVIDFNWRSSNHDKNLMFFQSVHNSLERRRTVKSNFERLSFHVITNDHLNLPEVLENMLSFAIDKKIRELKLVWIRSEFITDPKIKSLPKEIFSVETIKKICFSSLKFDSKDLILSCPLIEEFTIFHCTGFKSIEVATCARFIKNLRITECSGLERIHMEEDSPASLESFSYTYHSKDKASLYCKIYINLASRKSLKSFQLEGAQVTEEWFLNQVSQFVSLEKLTLGFCRTIVRNMCINHERLKCLKLKQCGPLEDVDILVQGIESFLYGSEKFAFDQIKISGCTFLKNLELLSVTITDKLIENLGLSGLMFLENLSFHSCKFKMINSFKLYFENLKSLEFWCCKYLVSPVFGNLEIGSPNLVSFNYTGDLMPFIPVSVISSSTHISGEIEIFYYDVTRKFQLQKDLRDFLHLFGHFNELFLSGGFTVDLIYPQQLRKTFIPPLYEVKHLKVEPELRLRNVVELVDGLLWLAPHPETICLIRRRSCGPNIESRITFFYSTPSTESKKEEDNVMCCSLSLVKCWRHDLTKVALENFEDISRRNLESYFIENTKATII